MPTYSKEFENRKEEVNTLVKKLYDIEDRNILSALYSVANMNNDHKDESKLDKVNGTFFKNLDMKSLLDHYKRENFNTKGPRYYEELFQEIYNRQSKINGYEPRYVVEVSGEAGSANGFMRHGSNMLNINAGMIEKYKLVDAENDSIDRKNANTIGPHSLLTLIHETQHTFQSEGVMNFVLDRETDSRTRARDAISLARMTLSNYAYDYSEGKDKEEQKQIIQLIRGNYWYDSMEHDSNMAPVRFIKNQIKEGNITDRAFIKAETQRIVNDIHINNCVSQDQIPATLKTRGDKMEAVVNGYLHYFKKCIKDGELKNKVVDVLEAYMQKDENGLSQYRKDLNGDFNMCLNFLEYAKSTTNAVQNHITQTISGFKSLNNMHYVKKVHHEIEEKEEETLVP